jgi:glycosyltransferase involved in cell wall biosynthesis
MKRRIKLLLLIPHLGGGGAERVIAQIATHLDPERFEMHLGLIAPDFPGAQALPEWVRIHRLGCERVRRAGPALVQAVRAIEPDVLLSGMAHLNFLVLLLKPLFPRQTRVLVRQNTTASLAATSWLGRLSYRSLYPRADRIVCQSQAMADDLAECFAIPPGKLVVLANPIDLPTVGIKTHSSVWPDHAWPRVLAIGRLSVEKGVDLLIRAMASVEARFPHACLIVLGDGAEEPALRKLAEELQLANSVHLAGYLRNPSAFYEGATVFVQPSRYEGMPNAMLEAAAAGLPIVATPCSKGVCELLDGVPGAWVAGTITAESLAETLLEALADLPHIPETQRRFSYPFLKAFATETAIAGYASLFESEAARAGQTHVAMVIPTLDRIGGAERQVILLSEELAVRGYRVTIVALSGTGADTAERLKGAGVEFVSLGMRKAWVDPRGWVRYLGWVRWNRPEVMHTHLPHATWFARWVRLLAPVRVQIDTVHTSRIGGWAWRMGYRITRRLPGQVTCVSTPVADAATSAGIVLRQRLGIVANGVPLTDELPAGIIESPAKPFRWIAVGRLAPVKDYPTLLRAFAALPGEPLLEILGTGPEEPRLRALALEEKISDRVHFAGFQANIAPHLAASDGFVLSSLWEGLPMGVLEAGAAGLPVVATEGAGTREALVPGETGIVVPVGDAAALAEAMAAVMAMEPRERLAMGRRGRRFVEERFSLRAVADRWEEMYAELQRARPKPARWG